MKNSILILFIFISCSIFSQSSFNLETLLERLEENHTGSVSDVFTLEEQQILRAYFTTLHENNETAISGGGIYLFGPNNSQQIFGKFDVVEPTTIIDISNSPLTEFEGAGAWDYGNLEYKVIDNAGSLYKLSLSGTYEYQSDLTFPAGESIVGLEYDFDSGTLYGLSSDGAGSSTLSTIDTDNGIVNPIGNTGITLPINLALDHSGFGYAIGIDGNFSYKFNLVTAETTELGPSGFDPNFGQGMTYDFNNHKIYLGAFNNDTFKAELRTLDINTGMTTYIGDIGSIMPGGTVQMGWTGSPANQLSVIDFNNFSFSFFPNPARGVLTVRAKEAIETVEIYNLLGQQIISQKIDALSSNINVSHLTSGNYILHVRINNQFETYKLIKQ